MQYDNEFSPLVSIIVPVFNGENTITRCLNSMLAQSYSNIEIIIVNDGSKDNTLSVIKPLISNDDRIILINQENSGVSEARNHGINLAKGDYFLFVDADDEIDVNMCRALVNALDCGKYHSSACGYISIAQCGKKKERYKKHYLKLDNVDGKKNFLKNFKKLYNSNVVPSPCGLLYSARIIKEYGLRFKPGMNMGEDTVFNLAYFSIYQDIGIIKDCLYKYYISTAESLTKNYSVERLVFIDDVMNKMIEFYESMDKDTGVIVSAISVYIRTMMILLENHLKDDDYEILMDRIYQSKYMTLAETVKGDIGLECRLYYEAIKSQSKTMIVILKNLRGCVKSLFGR